MFERLYKINRDGNPYDTTAGSWSEGWKAYDVNYSTILSKLIFEAGRWCEHYASDLFIYWKSFDEELHNKDYTGGTYVFGFRECGVDDEKAILTQVNDNGCSTDRYRAIWIMDVAIEDNDIKIQFFKGRLGY